MSIWQQLSDKGIEPPPRVAERFDVQLLDAFLAFLESRNAEGGFFSSADAERILERHLFESVVLVDEICRRLEVEPTTQVADVGSGPGLPGFVFACLRTPPAVTLVDSSRRRLGLVEKHLAGAVSGQLDFLYERAEEVADPGRDRLPSFDIVTARAFAPYPFSVELVCRMVAPGGTLALATGTATERGAPGPALADLGFRWVDEVRLPTLDFLGERHLLLLQRSGKPKRGYPRPWRTIQAEIRRGRDRGQQEG